MPDKFTATWVSHSSMGDFLRCPRAYFLHNVYKDPQTRRKINVVSPAMSLGIAVHAVLEGLRPLPVAERMEQDLLATLEHEWEKVSGKRGGFVSDAQEQETKARAVAMIERAKAHPGPLVQKTILLPQERENKLPHFYLSETDNIILCGKVDWVEYVPESDALKIIDFKTGKHEEKDGSLQLPIYTLLLNALQKRPVVGAAYWYLEYDDTLQEKTLPTLEEAREQVLQVAREVKHARDTRSFACPHGEEGCATCRPFEAILRGEAEYVGVGEYNQDLYLVSA
jgi:ATP-dependent helicase/DNAse subunit B